MLPTAPTAQIYDGILLDGKLSEYEQAFTAIDRSGNGTIGATEVAQLFQEMGNPVSYEKLVSGRPGCVCVWGGAWHAAVRGSTCGGCAVCLPGQGCQDLWAMSSW